MSREHMSPNANSGVAPDLAAAFHVPRGAP